MESIENFAHDAGKMLDQLYALGGTPPDGGTYRSLYDPRGWRHRS